MKYKLDRNASAEILRLIIKHMSAHPAAMTPNSYSVWYEHVSGINSALSIEIETLLNKKLDLDDATVERLYLNHISSLDEEVVHTLRKDIFLLLSKILEFTTSSDTQTIEFSSNLRSFSDQLKHNLNPLKLAELVSKMISDADVMVGFMKKINAELTACKQKGESLHSELKNARKEAITDPLTGVLNRRGFEMISSETFVEQAKQNTQLCLLMVDIDFFKNINDQYGHLFGDRVIRVIAETLKYKVRGQDCVARIGGEEFVVLLADTDIRGACIVAENIRRTIEACRIVPHGSQEAIGGVTVSIGIALYTNNVNLLDLLDQADQALFQSKSEGRNRTTVYAKI
jgi:diguanylate cyclase